MTGAEAWKSKISPASASDKSSTTPIATQQHTKPNVTKRLFCIGKPMKKQTFL